MGISHGTLHQISIVIGGKILDDRWEVSWQGPTTRAGRPQKAPREPPGSQHGAQITKFRATPKRQCPEHRFISHFWTQRLLRVAHMWSHKCSKQDPKGPMDAQKRAQKRGHGRTYKQKLKRRESVSLFWHKWDPKKVNKWSKKLKNGTNMLGEGFLI